MKKPVSFSVNGAAVDAAVVPRLHLADFLRGELGLTGTHLGCEQGVCGACTVIIDGRPARSCITYAIACEGAEVTTIEGLDDDPIMRDLREAFSANHGLQCGFCTPGMLVAARDLIARVGECDEAVIREELSGNLCRCTGYVGIVAAVKAVSVGRHAMPKAACEALLKAAPAEGSQRLDAQPLATPALDDIAFAMKDGWTELSHRICLAAKPDAVWRLMQDIPTVAQCLPGAEVGSVDGERLTGRVVVKFGPIKAAFAGNGTISLDQATRSGLLRGQGRDAGSGSQTQGELKYVVRDSENGGCAVEVEMRYRLSGPLAQFSRGALVRDLVGHLATRFGQNVTGLLDEKGSSGLRNDLDVFGLIWTMMKSRARSLLSGWR